MPPSGNPNKSPLALAVGSSAKSGIAGSTGCNLLANAIDRAVEQGGGWAVAAAVLTGTGPGVAAALALATFLGVRGVLSAKKHRKAQQLADDLRRHAARLADSSDRVETLLLGIADGTYPITLDGIALAEIRHAVEQVLAETPDRESLRRWDDDFTKLLGELPQKTYALLAPDLRSLHEKLDAIAENEQRFLGIAETLLQQAKSAEQLAAALRSEKENLERELAAAIARLANATAAAGGDVEAKLDELRGGDARVLLEFLDEQIKRQTDDLAELHLERHAAAFAAIDYPAALESARVLAALRHTAGEARNCYGFMLQTVGRYQEALAEFEVAERIDRKAFGDQHPNVAIRVNNIGSALKALGRYEEAIEKYKEAERIDRKAFGDEHPKIAIRINNIGGALEALGRHEEAIEKCREAERIDRKAFGDEHPKIAIRVNNIGSALEALGRYEEAVEKYRKAQRIFEVVLPADHPHLKIVRDNIAAVEAELR